MCLQLDVSNKNRKKCPTEQWMTKIIKHGKILCLTGPDVSTKLKRLVFEWLLKLSPPTLVRDVCPMRTHHVCIFQENANKNTKLFYQTYPALSDIP